MAPVLLSRTLDPLLGICTGAFAYYLYENNPRTAPRYEERLGELIRWKMAKAGRHAEEHTPKAETMDWHTMIQEANKKE